MKLTPSHSKHAPKTGHHHAIGGHRLKGWVAVAFAVVFGFGGYKLVSDSHASAVYNPPSTIAADCSVNVSATLNAWLASVPNGSTINFNGGCFRIDQQLNLNGRSNLVLDGGGATFKTDDPTGDSSSFDSASRCATGYSATVPDKAARTRMQWNVNASTNITFTNMIVHGANPCGGTGDYAYNADLEAQHAFNLEGNTNITIDSVQAYDTYGDFVYFRGTTNGVVRNSHFDGDGRQGISVTGGGPVLIENNYLANTRRATFDFEPALDTQVVDGVTVRGNTIGAGRLLFVAADGGGTVNDVTIENNTLTRCISIQDDGKAALRRHGWTVQNNTTTHNCGGPTGGAAFNFRYTDTVRVFNNVQPIEKNRGDNGVNAPNSTDVQVKNNSFVNAVLALNPATSTGFVACSNKITTAGGFDQPGICQITNVPAAGTPVAAAPVSAPHGSATPLPSASPHKAGTSQSKTSQSATDNIDLPSGNPANPVIALTEEAASSSRPPTSRALALISSIMLIAGFLGLCIMLMRFSMLMWAKVHLRPGVSVSPDVPAPVVYYPEKK